MMKGLKILTHALKDKNVTQPWDKLNKADFLKYTSKSGNMFVN